MGILYIISTPLGNLKDITLRALEILSEVDLVICEDTRQTLKLLNRYQIKKPLISYFQHSKLSKVEYLFKQLADGKNLGLVTDAGTPGISDPGNKLIAEFLFLAGQTGQRTLKIVPVPGPCAAIAALSVAGFPTDKFIFLGFPPHKKGRENYFKEILEAKQTVVFYESPYRIIKTLKQLAQIMPQRQLVICREMTKMFENIYRGKPLEILEILESNKNNQKGEFTIVVKSDNRE